MSVNELPSSTLNTTNLIGRPIDGVRRSRTPLLVRNCGIALERMEQDIETGTQIDASRATLCVAAVDNAECRSEGTRGDAGLETEIRHVDDGRSGRLGASPSRGGDYCNHNEEGISSISDRRTGLVRRTYWRSEA